MNEETKPNEDNQQEISQDFFKHMETQTELENLFCKKKLEKPADLFHWQYKNEIDSWENYDTPISTEIEQNFQSDKNSNFSISDKSQINHYFFDLNTMTETNDSTGKSTSIRRKIVVLEDENEGFDSENTSFPKKLKSRLFSKANQIDPKNVETYLEKLGPNKKKLVYENLMNYGLQISNGNAKDPFIKLLKDINPIDDSEENFQKIIQEVKFFLDHYEKYGNYKLLLKTGNEILIKESKDKKPNLDKYLNKNGIQMKFLSEKKRKLYFSINDHQFNLMIKRKNDGRFRFDIDSKDKNLKIWTKNMISFLKESHLTYISIPAFLSRCIQEFSFLQSNSVKNFTTVGEIDKNLFKELKEKYMYTWGETDSVKSELPFIYETNQYIKKQFERLKEKGLVIGSSNKENENIGNEGIDVRSPNPFVWFVKFSKFPIESSIGKDLKIHSKKFNSDENILLEVKFTSEFPQKPPIVRVLSPRFIYSTGNITTQGNFCLDILSPKLWSNSSDMAILLSKIKENFIDSNARVDLRIQKLYEKSPESSPTPTFNHKIFETNIQFEQEFFAFSSNFASRCFNGFYHNKLENANNLILPQSTAKTLRKLNNVEPISMEISTKIFKSYCGVLDFCAPPNSVIFPNWMMSDMMLDEGTKITLKSVDIPLVEMVTFRPLSKSFYKFKNTAELMTRALRPFVTLYQGQCVPLRVGGNTLMLEVVSFEPSSNVGRIQKNYDEYHDLKINFETALDFENSNQQLLTRKNSLFQQNEPNPEKSPLEKTKSFNQMINQDDTDRIECENCKQLVRKGTLDIHSIHCKRNFYFCVTCSSVVKKTEEVSHNEHAHKKLECKYCKEQVYSIQLEQHQVSCQLEEIKDCTYCKLEFSSKEIESHVTECIKREHQCETCGFLFKGDMMDDHIKYCQESFYDEYSYDRYDEEEPLLEDDPCSIAEGSLACNYCDLKNQTKDALKQHIVEKHPDDPDQFLMVLEFL